MSNKIKNYPKVGSVFIIGSIALPDKAGGISNTFDTMERECMSLKTSEEKCEMFQGVIAKNVRKMDI